MSLLYVSFLALVALLPPAQALLQGEGKWEAKPHDIPAATLTLTAENGKLDGNVVFYCLGRTSDGWKVVGEHAMPMIEPSVTGSVLTFKLAYDTGRCLPPYSDNPPLPFTFMVTADNQGLLTSGAPGDVGYIRLPMDK